MQTTSIKMTSGNTHHYYRCPKRVKDGKAACDNARNGRAAELEGLVWGEVATLLRDPDRLRAGLSAMIAAKRERLRTGPDQDAQAWHAELDGLARKRAAYQGQQAAGHMTLDELGARLAEIEDAREVAERELSKLRTTQQEIDALEADADALLASYEDAVPERLDALGPEERHRIYRLMRLTVRARPDGSLDAEGDIPLDISNLDTTGTRSAWSTSARSVRIRGALPGPSGKFCGRTRT